MQILSLSRLTLQAVLMERMLSLLLVMIFAPLDVRGGYQNKPACCPQNHNFYYYPAPTPAPTPAPYTPPPPPKQYPFLPAPPGKTPSCAKGGKTFCPKIDSYPTQLIQYLLYKWGRTYGPFIVSESDQEFVPPKEPEPEPTYGYDYPPGTPYEAPQGYFDHAYNHTYGPPEAPVQHHHQPLGPTEYLQQQQQQPQSPLQQYPQQQQQSQYQQPLQSSQSIQKFQHYPAQSPQMSPGTQSFEQIAAVTVPPISNSYWWSHRNSSQPSYLAQHRLRVKRQATAADNEQLCPVRTQYFTPQAAMNKDGTWMYVVNMPNETRYVQQVKTETCINAGSSCNNICSLPPGYRSNCKQLMVQKRLVALAGSGDRLMSDVFWFPSCCVCQINTA